MKLNFSLHPHAGAASVPDAKKIALVGNPNVGKSLIFVYLTGRYVTVSNYPGTTVEMTYGKLHTASQESTLVDAPGISSLTPLSEEEQVVRDMLFKGDVQTVIQVVDAKNLERGLYLTAQIAELDLPVVLVLNMMDEADARGLEIDVDTLSDLLGVPVIPAVATQKKGLNDIVNAIPNARIPNIKAHDPEAVEAAPLRGQPLSHAVELSRLAAARQISARTLHSTHASPGRVRDWLGHLAMHPVWGIPFLLGALYAAWWFVGRLGAGVLVNFFEKVVFGRFVNPFFLGLVPRLLPWPILSDFLVGPFGLITMAFTYALAIVLPIVGTFFVFFGLLEDSGYMPRLAVMVDKIFKPMGLNGKAVLPMVLGLGCDTMATLTARILSTEKERILVTFLLALGVPCSAQLGVLLAMTSTLPVWALPLWGVVVVVILFAVGFIAARIIPGASTPLILEIPPMRIPTLRNILMKTLARIEWYLKEAVPLFICGTALLFLLDRLRLLEALQRLASPVVVKLLGLPKEAANAFLVGFLRRDYGAAGLFDLQKQGRMDVHQTLVSLIVITLFVPCVANLLIILKERGGRTALAIISIVFTLAFLIGGIMHRLLGILGV